MARRRGNRRNRGRDQSLRFPAAAASWRMRGQEQLGRALRGLLARRPVRRVLLGSAAKIFFQIDVPEALAPAVLQDAACDIARRLHGEPTHGERH